MADATNNAAPSATTADHRPGSLARGSWMLFDWAAQPYYTLILTFVFAPYFVNIVVGDAARGQAMWGFAATIAGIGIALGSPLIGAAADGSGQRKFWIGCLGVVFAGAVSCLWWAVPNADASTLWIVLAAFIIATLAAEFTQVLVNAMMPGLAPADQLGRLSGNGWAVGYVGGLLSLALVAGALVTAPGSDQTLLGTTPLITADMLPAWLIGDAGAGAAAYPGDRLVGPLAAVWFLLFMIPYFLFVPDNKPWRAAGNTPPTPAAPVATQSAFASLWQTLRALPQTPDMLYFLIARALYSDGLAAIFAFGGIYGASVFGWRAAELGLFGIILSVAGAIGAVAGGRLDDRFGARTIIITALVILLIGAAGILSVTPTKIFYVIDAVPRLAGAAPFATAGEWVFLAFAILVGLAAAPVQASSRSLLARLAPPDRITQYFGLFAFSGKVTAFLAPLAVASVTTATGDQRIGMATIAVFLVAGIVLMLQVRPPQIRP